MRSSKNIQVVSCHAEGEPGDVIVGGVSPPKGDTLWAQSRTLEQQSDLRDFLLNEPRGGIFSPCESFSSSRGSSSRCCVYYHGGGVFPANVRIKCDLCHNRASGDWNSPDARAGN